MHALFNRMFNAIADDCLVRAILDDDSRRERRPGEHGYDEHKRRRMDE